MAQRNTQKLRAVSNFPDLVDYLRDDLDWPIEVEDAEEIVFEYDPDELGIDPKYAVKINSIRQIRPLAEGQPWGVFYIDFESKKLPVVVLRRILRAFVSSTRSRQAERPVWDMNDLLFISAFGEEVANQREIAFAHFHQEAGNLPTLRVLGWDGSDTPLKLEYVDATLQRTMRWPDDSDDHEAWREAWSQTFRHRLGHVIRTADALAAELAGLARQIRDAATLLLAHETESGPLRSLHKAFQTALIHDLTEADFADTYAQTITYGLLTAAISRTEMSNGQYGTALIVDNVADIVPVTNPFLKEMLQTFLSAGGRKGGIDFDELGIQDVVDLLRGDETDLPAVLRDFGNKTKGEDPVIHFYEYFLAAYDKKLKVKRGVFYTPRPVVSYIVRSVHELLQTEFGLEDGLADTTTWGEMAQRCPDLTIPKETEPDSPFVVILDPATGTATFLVEVVEVIHQTLTAKWQRDGLNAAKQKAAWNEYVPQHLLPRLHGYELMMAPYAIAHMKMGLKLHETGYRFGSEERVRIYLTNTLEKPDNRPSLAGILPALAHEAQAVNHIKQQQNFTVAVGNPPYSGHSANQIEDDWIGLRDEYYSVDGKPLGERNPKWLQDDYVKFIRFGQQRIESTGVGILALITNHGYLDNPTFRGMRESLLQTFDEIYVLDLHGNAKKKETALDGGKDENVFDIMQGVAIGIFVKNTDRDSQHLAQTHHQDLYGLRGIKYRNLFDSTFVEDKFTKIKAREPFYLFISQDVKLLLEYGQGWLVTKIWPISSVGIVTARDNLTIQVSKNEVWQTVDEFAKLSVEEARIRFGLGADARDWKVHLAQNDLINNGLNQKNVVPITYRPFDLRYTYYTGQTRGFHCMPRSDIMAHLIDLENRALLIGRSGAVTGDLEWNIVSISNKIVDFNYYRRGGNQVFPLYLFPSARKGQQTSLFDQSNLASSNEEHNQREPNLSPDFIADVEKRLDLQFIKEGLGDFVNMFGPEDVLHYSYAIFHSPTYRERYAEFLKIDFPRLPLTNDLFLFRKLAQLGADLVALHLHEDGYAAASWMLDNKESPLAQTDITFHEGSDGRLVGKFSRKNYQNRRVYCDSSKKAGISYFEGIEEEVWNFQIGGYQVLHKWLYDRRTKGKTVGRSLTDEDIYHYPRIATALRETIRIMAEIDKVIEEHGGWPLQ